jgi:hypothetical protein
MSERGQAGPRSGRGELKLPKGHLSYSQLVQFADCPAYWKAVNLDGREASATERMRLGGAVHDLIGRHLSGLLGEEAQVAAAHELSPALAAEALELFSKWRSRWADAADGAPANQVEETMEFEVATEPPVLFQARLDFWRQEERIPVIHDWKTSARLPADSEAADIGAQLWCQLLTYALALRRSHGRADRYGLRLVYLRYGVVHDHTAADERLDEHEQALIASCQSVLLAVQAGQFRRRPGRACAGCPLRRRCDLSLPLGKEAADVAQAWLFHRERARELEEMVRGLADGGGIELPERAGVEVGYRQQETNRTISRVVNRRRQVLGLTEAGEEVWVEPLTKGKKAARFGVWEVPRRAVGPAA